MGGLCGKQHPKSMDFREFVQDGKLEQLRTLYEEEGRNVQLLTDADSEGRQPLHISATLGYPDITKFLMDQMLAHSLSIDPDCGNGKTPLWLACMRGYKEELEVGIRNEIIKLLLKAGADPSAMNSTSRMSCVHWASYFTQDSASLNALLESKADFLGIDSQGYTPFDIAGMKAENKEFGNLDALLKHAEDNLDSRTIQLSVNSNMSSVSPAIDAKFSVVTKEGNYTTKMRAYLTVLYWAAYRNMKELVKKMIGFGISPFLRDYNSENALIGAIKGGAKECVQFIMESSYAASDEDASFDVKAEGVGQLNMDGNNALHVAGLLNKYEIFDFLSSRTSMTDTFNVYGYLPIDYNNHEEEEVKDKQGEYLVVVSKEKDKNNNVKEQLKRAGFTVTEYPSVTPENRFLELTVDDNHYHSCAKELELEVLGKEVNTLEPYNEMRRDMYFPFTRRQKHMMIQYLIREEIDIANYTRFGIVVDHFPLHSRFKEKVIQSWQNYYFSTLAYLFVGANTKHLIPIFMMGGYFGEKIGMYFAWLSHYTAWLIYIVLAGIVVSVFQLINMEIDHELIPLYCLVVSLWITLMLQFWKRRQAELAEIWSLANYKGQDTEREDFESETIIHRVTKDMKKKSFVHSLLRAVLFNIPMVLCGLAMIAGAFIGFRVWASLDSSFENSILVGAINGISISVLNNVYLILAWVLTDLENHKYESEWENSYITKIYSLQFVNCYVSLFAIAFYDASLVDLGYSLVSIFIAKQVISNLTEMILPWILDCFFMSRLKKTIDQCSDLPVDPRERERCIKAETEFSKSKNDLILYEYLEMVTQIGYITMFSSALPITSLFALLNNLWEIRGEVMCWTDFRRRPIADGAKNIGAWEQILDLLSIISTGVNCGVIYYTSTKYVTVFEDYFNITNPLHMFYIVIAFEHGLLVLKWIINWVIPDVPKAVLKQDKYKKLLNNQRLIKALKEGQAHRRQNLKFETSDRAIEEKKHQLEL